MYGGKLSEISNASFHSRGMIPRLLDGLIASCGAAEASDEIKDAEFEASLYEVYGDQLNDLLGSRSQNMLIREHPQFGVFVKGATVFQFRTTDEALTAVDAGLSMRKTASTHKNQRSSRSHAILAITVKVKPDNSGQIRYSKVNLIDLAGSERATATEGKSEQVQKEGRAINSSLSVLGRVINALAKGQRAPLRDSKLTRLLTESLGGNAYLMMFMCCSPSTTNLSMSRSTLQFATRCRGIKNKAKINITYDMDKMQEELASMQKRVHELSGVINHFEDHSDELGTMMEEMLILLNSGQGDERQEEIKRKATAIQEVGTGLMDQLKRHASAILAVKLPFGKRSEQGTEKE